MCTCIYMSILNKEHINAALDEVVIQQMFEGDLDRVLEYHKKLTSASMVGEYIVDFLPPIAAICSHYGMHQLPNDAHVEIDRPAYTRLDDPVSGYIGLSMHVVSNGTVLFDDREGKLMSDEKLLERIFIHKDINIIIYTSHPHPRILYKMGEYTYSRYHHKQVSLGWQLENFTDVTEDMIDKHILSADNLRAWMACKTLPVHF